MAHRRALAQVLLSGCGASPWWVPRWGGLFSFIQEGETKMPFNFKRYLIKVQGGRYYLPVAARLVWFREAHPDWRVETEPLELDVERGIAIFRARVMDEEGNVLATGTKMETREGFADFIEKAETGAIGRALAVAGFGTQFAPELSEGGVVHPVDSPVAALREREEPPRELRCSDCGTTITEGVYKLSENRYGRPLCASCQKKHTPLAQPKA
jgi:hypothetical protein